MFAREGVTKRLKRVAKPTGRKKVRKRNEIGR
jgi:hypothetical protein